MTAPPEPTGVLVLVRFARAVQRVLFVEDSVGRRPGRRVLRAGGDDQDRPNGRQHMYTVGLLTTTLGPRVSRSDSLLRSAGPTS